MTDQLEPNELEEASKTDPPPAPETHGFLESFKHLSADSFEELKSVVTLGLQPVENEILITVAAKLIGLATIHDPQALDKLNSQFHSHT